MAIGMKIVRLRDVMQRTGLSRSTIYARLRDGEFPSAIRLGPRAVGWLECEIEDWIEARIDETRRQR